MQIERNRELRWTKLHQEAYTTELLIDWQMDQCTPVDTPMDLGTARALMLLPNGGHDRVAISKYQSLVGALLWLYKTRPDVMFATPARFTLVATPAHLQLAMRVLKYLNGTRNYGIVFMAGFPEDGIISAEGNADLAGDLCQVTT